MCLSILAPLRDRGRQRSGESAKPDFGVYACRKNINYYARKNEKVEPFTIHESQVGVTLVVLSSIIIRRLQGKQIYTNEKDGPI